MAFWEHALPQESAASSHLGEQPGQNVPAHHPGWVLPTYCGMGHLAGETCVFTVRFYVFATSVHNPRDLPGDGVEAQHLFLAQASPWIQLVGV